ncbi:SECIS-binding protein 2, putative (SBP2) [Plasmodium ovale wallikeri]|uniref:SECIS-binding protein 2, putative n=2 Tax=Plasmodium ovale TaxID=36330 RepID=A0A1C3KRV6_PLAOA|nr:SECIS-binding protein 2, putative (SBP2) [Plasmodium ovale wallikeri]SBT35003.1 SECIS-binding protein 2, putative (SBP2) [Plasmodium ovale wallikeri]SBT76873.1 SECIS-binding protein 2, putative [Plasmodium ovale]
MNTKRCGEKNYLEKLGRKRELLKNEKGTLAEKIDERTDVGCPKDFTRKVDTKKIYQKEGKKWSGRLMNIGNRLVKITFSSDKKKMKYLEKKKKMHILMKQKKKKRKEFEEKKKMMNNLHNILVTEREKGNFYFLPKRLKKKKKTKLQRMIILEKEIKKGICDELMQKMEIKKTTLNRKFTGCANNNEKDVYLQLIKNRTKWNLEGATCTFYHEKQTYICSRRERKRKLYASYFYQSAYKKNLLKNGNRRTVKEVINLKEVILLWGKKYTQYAKKKAKKIQIVGEKTLNAPCGKKGNIHNVKHVHVDNRTKQSFSKVEMRTTHTKEEVEHNSKKGNKLVVLMNNYNTNVTVNEEETYTHTTSASEDFRKEQIKENILKNEKIINFLHVSKIEKKIYINEYVDHKITDELNNMVKEFLKKISISHEKLVLLKKKKRYYMGLKESYKHICINQPKLVLVAPNIEPMLNNVFDDLMKKIIFKCKEKNIPLVYALSKNLLGKCIGKPRQSIICIIDNDSFIKECNEIINLASSLKIGK